MDPPDVVNSNHKEIQRIEVMLYITIWWEVWQQLHEINDKNVKAIST